MIDDPEKFLDEYDPDVFSDLNLRKFINNFVTCVKFEPIYEIINQFSNSDFNGNFEENPIEVCRILHFFSIFRQSLCDGNKVNLTNFLLEKIPMLIEKIGDLQFILSFYCRFNSSLKNEVKCNNNSLKCTIYKCSINK